MNYYFVTQSLEKMIYLYLLIS